MEKVKNSLKEKPLIGFVGAPWTLLLYMLNKKSPKNNFDFDKINEDKSLINKLLGKLEKIICLHVDKQIEAGANIIQIFDSWAGLLPKKELQNYCYMPTQKIVEVKKIFTALKKQFNKSEKICLRSRTTKKALDEQEKLGEIFKFFS